MAIYIKDEAFVLKVKTFKEEDAIVSLFTKNYGKIFGIIKKFKTSKKNIYIFDQLNFIKAFFVIKNRKIKIISGLVLDEIKIPRENFKNWLWTFKVLNNFTIKEKAEKEIFNFLILCSRVLTKKLRGYKTWFLIKMLQITGFFIFDIFCFNCSNAISEGFFNNGIFCKNCQKKGVKIKRDDIIQIKKIADSNFPLFTSKKIVSILKNILKNLT